MILRGSSFWQNSLLQKRKFYISVYHNEDNYSDDKVESIEILITIMVMTIMITMMTTTVVMMMIL